MPNQELNIELRSEEVQDILGKIPPRIVRYGITWIFLIIIIVLVGSWFVKYSDVITGKAIITTTNPPIKIFCQKSGIIDSIYVKNGTYVKTGDVLLEINNTLKKKDIEKLRQFLEEMQNSNSSEDLENSLFNVQSLTLGDIQSTYNSLITSYSSYYKLKEETYQKEKIALLEEQIEYYKNLEWITQKQIILKKSEVKNAEEDFTVNEKLFKKGYTAKFDFHKEIEAYNNKKQELENIKKTYFQNKITIKQLQDALLEKKYTYESNLITHENQINTQISTIKISYKNMKKQLL